MPSQAQLDRLARLLKTTSQAEIARQMKISRGTVSNWIKKLDGKEAKPRTASAGRFVGAGAASRSRTQTRAPRAAATVPVSGLEQKAIALRNEAEAILKSTTAEIDRLQLQQADARRLLEKLSGERKDLRKRNERRVKTAVAPEGSVPRMG